MEENYAHIFLIYWGVCVRVCVPQEAALLTVIGHVFICKFDPLQCASMLKLGPHSS